MPRVVWFAFDGSNRHSWDINEDFTAMADRPFFVRIESATVILEWLVLDWLPAIGAIDDKPRGAR